MRYTVLGAFGKFNNTLDNVPMIMPVHPSTCVHQNLTKRLRTCVSAGGHLITIFLKHYQQCFCLHFFESLRVDLITFFIAVGPTRVFKS